MEMLREPVPSPQAWIGKELAKSSEWVTYWTAEELKELDDALRSVAREGFGWGQFGRDQFRLPGLAARLRWIESELIDGRGFVLMRGLPVERYSVQELKTIYWGLSVNLGRVMSQNARGAVIEHITDTGAKNIGDPNLRLYVTSAAQPPHADQADVVGLLSVDRAKEGGESVIASMMAIYNRILQEHPEYLEVLYEGMYHDLRGEGQTGDINETSDVPVPVFSYRNKRLRSWFHGKKLRYGAGKRNSELTPLQRQAIDYIERLGADPDLRLDVQLERGDIQFLNNYSSIHWRTAFTDGDGHKRLLLRVWINLEKMDDFDPAITKWVREGVAQQNWAFHKSLVALGEV